MKDRDNAFLETCFKLWILCAAWITNEIGSGRFTPAFAREGLPRLNKIPKRFRETAKPVLERKYWWRLFDDLEKRGLLEKTHRWDHSRGRSLCYDITVQGRQVVEYVELPVLF